MRLFKRILFVFIVFSLIFASKVYAQLISPDTIIISGIILDADSLFSLPNAHILTHKNTGTITDLNGQFSFKSNANDTLTFSYVGYKDYKFVVPDTLKYNNYMMGILLNKDTIMLSEVIILPWMNKQQFKSAFKNSQPDINTVNATRNLNMMTYTARAYAPVWTEYDMVQYQLDQYTQKIEYKGMVSPGQSFNITGFASYLIFLAHQQLTKDEKEYRLRQELKQYIHQQQPE